MTIDQFWEIVDRVHHTSDGSVERKCELLGREIRALSLPELRSLAWHWGEFYYRAYNYELWDAAFLAFRGCSDDSFMDFRNSLVCLGRDIFERALRDPDSLADLELNSHDHCSQSYSIAFSKAYADVLKQHGLSEEDSPGGTGLVRPQKPTGVRSELWSMEARFPKLTAKSGHKDADHLWEKERLERLNRKVSYTLIVADQKTAAQGTFAELLLDAGIVRDSGWIPPYRVIGGILLDGGFARGDRRCCWDPFEWNEGDYWKAVREIGQLAPVVVAQRWPRLQGKKPKQDIATPKTDDYAAWIRSLAERGLEGE